jgi:hypothetical protein
VPEGNFIMGSGAQFLVLRKRRGRVGADRFYGLKIHEYHENKEKQSETIESRVKSPTRKPDVWGTPFHSPILRPGHPPAKHCGEKVSLDNAFVLIEGHPDKKR